MEWLNRVLCKMTGYHVYDSSYFWEIFPTCRFCKQHLQAGWPK